MPPFVGRKRGSESPLPTPQPPAKRAKTTAKPAPKPVAKAPPKLQQKVRRFSIGSDFDSSSLSDVDSDEFEDVPQSSKAAKAQKAAIEDDEDEDVEWEDAPAQEDAPDFSNREFKDLNLTIDKAEEPDYTARGATKKGPSKREKQARMWAHQMHVQFLLWHNAKRNEWINDKKVHETLVKQLPSQIIREVERWKRASGLIKQEEDPQPSPKDRKKKGKKWKANGERNEREWGRPSTKLEEGKPDMSHGDPIINLLKMLAAYWKKRFAITAPGLRKRGYSSKLALRKDIDSYRSEKHHPAKHGEKIESLERFRKSADECKGSRDVGAQLFTALLRALGIESRLVASLQPVGFGFTKVEEMVPRKIIDPESSDSEASQSEVGKGASTKRAPSKGKAKPRARRPGGKAAPIDLDSEIEINSSSEDNDSVVDVTPAMPKARLAKYDKDLLFPIYWTEAISPIASKVYPVSPLVLETAVATSPEFLSAFEPRGAKAEKTRQIMAYVVAYSLDFSAKDVTVRYLRKNLWPGKTKGFRIPIEKVPIYDKRGKVKRYEDYDWFKHVLSTYGRSDDKRTAVDDVEDSTDLVPAEPEKKQIEGDTLQSLKSSTEFVLERHLRREEALVSGAEPVRTFINGKGEKQEEIPVYKRSDVRRVMTAESWHKEGRRPKEGEGPMKLAPVRAVTTARKREAEDHLIRTGEKQMQGLYSQEQTDWIIPPPIKDGKIPKNAYGNIDCFVPSMVPKGAVHLPLKGCVRICKKLSIDFSEAVVGFEFGNRMAVPVVKGVVIAKENEKVLRDAWREWNEEQRKKEETKMEKLVLEMWRKMVMGLRIRDRVAEEYGDESARPATERGRTAREPIDVEEEERAGGFMAEDDGNDYGGGFLVDHEDVVHHHEELTFDHHLASQEEPKAEEMDIDPSQEYPTPLSAPASAKYSARKHAVPDSDESELSEAGDGSAEPDQSGGFLQDDNEHEPQAVKSGKGPKQRSAFLSSVNGSASSEPEYTSQAKPRSRGQTRKAAARREPRATSMKTGKGRKTPARGAKARIPNMNIDGAASSEEDELDEDDVAAASSRRARPKAKPDRNSQRGRGQPEKSNGTPSASTPKRAKRLLRKESTIVTSPYFDQ